MGENSITYELSMTEILALLVNGERIHIGNLMGYPWYIFFSKYNSGVTIYLQTHADAVEGGIRIVYVHLLHHNETKVKKPFNYFLEALSQHIYRFDDFFTNQYYGYFQFKIILHQQSDDTDIPISSNLPPESISGMAPSIKQIQIFQLNDLSQDLKALLLDDHLSDVTIKCHPSTFKAHKVILSSRSPVFKAMFSHPLEENITDTITIVDMDAEVVKSLINFIYSGQVDIQSIPEATCLLDAAEKYQIHSLKKGLIEYIKSVISEENAFELLELAELFDVNLKTYVLEFIGKHFNKLKQMKEWIEIKSTKPVLAIEVYSYLERFL